MRSLGRGRQRNRGHIAAVGVLSAAAALLGLVMLPGRAAASCAPAVPLSDALSSAPIAFLGTVTGLDNGGRVAIVQVTDVWKGASVGSVVRVVGTPDLGAAATSVDRTYLSGQQYLFVPVGGTNTDFQDNECTATQSYSTALAGLRPTGARGAPTSAAYSGGGFPIPLVGVGAGVAAVLAVVAAVMYRRRSRSVSSVA